MEILLFRVNYFDDMISINLELFILSYLNIFFLLYVLYLLNIFCNLFLLFINVKLIFLFNIGKRSR